MYDLDDIFQIIGAWKYMEYKEEIEGIVCKTDYLAIHLDGKIISRDSTKDKAYMKAIARGERHPLVMSGYEYLAIWKK